MQVSFDVQTRIGAILTLRSIQQASIIELRLRKEGLKVLNFSKEELEHFGVNVFTNGNYNWDPAKEDELITFEISEGVKNLICAQLDMFAAKKDEKGKTLFPVDLFAIADYFKIEDAVPVEKPASPEPAAKEVA